MLTEAGELTTDIDESETPAESVPAGETIAEPNGETETAPAKTKGCQSALGSSHLSLLAPLTGGAWIF